MRLSPYRNFERALTLLPADAELVALSDQDDRWYPDKLAALREALGSASLVYSDQRLVTEDGRILRDSLWHGRRHDRDNLASLLVANTAPGAAMLFRRELLSSGRCRFRTLPGVPYHDHWLRSGGARRRRPRRMSTAPLYDYVQHGGAVQGALERGRERGHRAPAGRAAGAPPTSEGYLPRKLRAQTLLAATAAGLDRPQAARAAADDRRRAVAWRVRLAGAASAAARCGGVTRRWAASWRWPAGSSWRWLLAAAVAGRETVPAPGRGMPASPTRRGSSSGGCDAGEPAADQPIRCAPGA